MAILTLGVNHTTAPVSIRERLAFPAEHLHSALHGLIGLPQVGEAAILSTCNRTELYCEFEGRDQRPIVDWMREQRQLHDQDLAQYLYAHVDAGTIRHMFRVACGLDSMILGEPQILGQMKTAYQAAREAGTAGKVLTKLFHHTFAAAKKVRTDTAIGCSPVSVAFAAIRLAQRIFDDLSDLTAILIGAGETIELTARHLSENRIGHIIIANRTFDRAHTLASQFDGFAISLEELPKHLAKADIIVASTGSPLPILGKGSIESALRSRRHKPMFIVDLAVPRDIEPEVEQLQDVYLYTVDDLQHTVEENLKTRQEAAMQAEEIIDLEVEHFLAWLRAQAATDTIRDLRNLAELHRDAALERALRELRRGKAAEDTLRWLAETLTNKIIHAPSSQVWQAGVNERADIVAAARELFQLKDTDT
ncbi:MAG: glutamyl-tRNA reductase [Methylococcus sp.]|nr:glutamyl-tRNA reductase [Methylococcus sp.]